MSAKWFSRLFGLWAKVKIWGWAGIASFFRREINVLLYGHKLRKLHAKSRTAVPERGITVIGELTEFYGLSKTLRDLIVQLKAANIPVQTFDTTWKPRIPSGDIAGLLTPEVDFDLHRYSHIIMMFRSPLPKDLAIGHTVGRIVFHEGDHGIHSTTPFLRESGDDIIAMSDFNYEYFKRAFPNQGVWKISYPFRFRELTAMPRGEVRRKYGIGENDFVVFFNFDFGSYYRKNIPGALMAFATAFKGDRTARLVFKTKGAKENKRQAADMMSKAAEVGISEQFIHIPQFLPKADIDGLAGACDVYLSLHKAEGFGLGIAEAMSQGKPVVVTGWSGNLEFCHKDTAWLVPYKKVSIQPHEYPVSMKEWAEADVEAAAAALREIRKDPESAAARASRGAVFMKEHFSLANFKCSVDSFLDGQMEQGDDE